MEGPGQAIRKHGVVSCGFPYTLTMVLPECGCVDMADERLLASDIVGYRGLLRVYLECGEFEYADGMPSTAS